MIQTRIIAIMFILTSTAASVNHTEPTYKVPEGLVNGGALIDLFRPIPVHEGLTSDVWGGANVKPRNKHNGLEDSKWSYWGGNVVTGADLLYNLAKDPNEQRDRAEAHPEKRDALARRLEFLLKEMQAEMPIRNPTFDALARKKKPKNLTFSKALAQKERRIFESRLEE